jgi:glycosyltransferase involved in cell wall biosynthesis
MADAVKEINGLLVDGVFINNSGGKVLLDYLVAELEDSGIHVFYLFDLRCEKDYAFIPAARKDFATDFSSRKAFYKQYGNHFESVLCFGNVPPPGKLKGKVYTYFHNVSLLEQPANYSFKERMMKWFKGNVIKMLAKNTDYFMVQTEAVKKLVLKNIRAKCLVVPFYKIATNIPQREKGADVFTFVSNGNTHKNHSTLLKAWDLLAERGLHPQLHLTVTENYPALTAKIKDAQTRGLKITNHGYTNAYELYAASSYQIYPSLAESFGLGLIEAVKCGCEVVAADLPYVYEVVEPSAVFDPMDANNIADVVATVLKGRNTKKTSLRVENKITYLIDQLRYETAHSIL